MQTLEQSDIKHYLLDKLQLNYEVISVICYVYSIKAINIETFTTRMVNMYVYSITLPKIIIPYLNLLKCILYGWVRVI